MQNNKLLIHEDDLPAWGNSLARTLSLGGGVIALQGDLGAGKTTIAGHIINALLPVRTVVASPTFNLVHVYPIHQQLAVWHFDLYRIAHADEIYELGWEQAMKEIAIIEWPQKIQHLLPKGTKIISISPTDNPKQRILEYLDLT